MIENTSILAMMLHRGNNLVKEIQEIRGVIEPLNEHHEFYFNPPVLIIPDGKTPRQRRREEERKNKVRRKWKPLC